MRFDHYIPCKYLQPFVKEFVISEQADEQVYKVLPGTSLVIGFQYRGSLSLIDKDIVKPLATAGITGLGNTYKLFRNSNNIGTVLVFFTETGASNFFDIPLNEIFSQSISLDNFIKTSILDNVREQLDAATDDVSRIVLIEQFLISQYRQKTEDKLVTEAIKRITASLGTIRIKELALQLHISQSPLEKRFRSIVGATPKKFASVIRLQALINNSGKSHSLTELGYTAGYFDQSHFIKDFKAFTGETPEYFFSGNQ